MTSPDPISAMNPAGVETEESLRASIVSTLKFLQKCHGYNSSGCASGVGAGGICKHPVLGQNLYHRCSFVMPDGFECSRPHARKDHTATMIKLRIKAARNRVSETKEPEGTDKIPTMTSPTPAAQQVGVKITEQSNIPPTSPWPNIL